MLATKTKFYLFMIALVVFGSVGAYAYNVVGIGKPRVTITVSWQPAKVPVVIEYSIGSVRIPPSIFDKSPVSITFEYDGISNVYVKADSERVNYLKILITTTTGGSKTCDNNHPGPLICIYP